MTERRVRRKGSVGGWYYLSQHDSSRPAVVAADGWFAVRGRIGPYSLAQGPPFQGRSTNRPLQTGAATLAPE
jgi:hypothetical protein